MCYEGSFQEEHDLASGYTPHRWTPELIEKAVQRMREAFRDGFVLIAEGKVTEAFDGPLRYVEDELDDLPKEHRETWSYLLEGLQGSDPQEFVSEHRNADGSLPTFEKEW